MHRTGAHRGPHTESINRSWASANVSSNARNGTSRDISTANDSNSAQDERASNGPDSFVGQRYEDQGEGGEGDTSDPVLYRLIGNAGMEVPARKLVRFGGA